jgi:hypothetical protein
MSAKILTATMLFGSSLKIRKSGLIDNMTIEEFMLTLENSRPPEKLSPYLKALWYDAKDDWKNSHETAQEIQNRNGAWIHAYLHRKEGDLSNAYYWYLQAGKQMPEDTFEEEWKNILNELINTS